MNNGKPLILLIDDVDAIVEELLTFIELNGMPAIGVSDLDEAITVLELHRDIRVLACDVRLGRESGLAIVSRIRQHPYLRDRPFHYLFITGDQFQPDPARDLPDHMILTKPVQPQLLISVLRDLLGKPEDKPQHTEGSS